MQTTKPVRNWLYFSAFCVVVMMFIGALTRLTESGLSITYWEPIKGILPPLSHEEWVRYFDAYKQTGEYQSMNSWMKLENFQGIFWLEYIHRLWGRLIGLVFLLPLIYFYATKKIDKKLALRLLGIFALGGLQGFVGWIMVKSGIGKDDLSVSHYRLALHLAIAVIIYALILWTAFSLKRPNKKQEKGNLALYSKILLGMIFFMIMLGAFVAGKDAGFMYNTFPLMDGKFIPEGIYMQQPWWINHFENGVTIQFQHRLFAYILTAAVVVFMFMLVNKDFRYMNYSLALAGGLVLQISLGIMTLLSFGTYADFGSSFAYHKVLHTPVMLAALHQVGAVILFTVALKITHKLTRK